MKYTFGLDDNSLMQIKTILNGFIEIEKVVIYGSRAKGNYRDGSDIDIALLGNITSTLVANLLDALDETYLPYTFDICAYNSIKNNDLRDHIDRVGKVFYMRDR